MSTPKTTQELARELADMLESKANLNRGDLYEILKDGGIKLPSHLYSNIFDAIKAEIDKEASSIKKALQEALANE